MDYLGDIRVGATIRGVFNTAVNGVLTALGGSPAFRVYKDASTTEDDSGITLNATFDSRTGLYHYVVDTSSDGTFYSAGSNFYVILTDGTLNGSTVAGVCVGAFSIENRSALMPTTADRRLDVTATGAAGIDWNNIENPTTAQNLSATNIDTDQVVASVSGAVGSVTGNVGGNVAGSVGSVTGNVGGNVTGSVGSVAAGGITSSSFGAAAIDAAAIAPDAIGSSELAASAASEIATAVRSELGTELGRIDVATSTRASQTSVDTIDDFLDLEIAAIKAQTDKLTFDGDNHVVADTRKISTDATAADNAEAFFDGSGYAGTNNVIPTVTTLTNDPTGVTTTLSRLGVPSNLGGGATVAANLSDIESQTDDIGAAGAGLSAIPWNASWDAEVESEVADALEATIADSVPNDGTRPSVKQALYMLTQFMLERSVSSTTVTVKKVDGTTSLFTLTLNDGTTPTSITRAT